MSWVNWPKATRVNLDPFLIFVKFGVQPYEEGRHRKSKGYFRL